MTSVRRSPAVNRFELEVAGPLVKGYAAPATGTLPSRIKLTSDGRDIAYGLATLFSETAAAEGLRRGWCGFGIEGLSHAFAVGDDVQLSCAASNQVLATIPFAEALVSNVSKSSMLTVSDILKRARESAVSPDLEHILPFAIGHLERYGDRQFLEASYLTLLRRWPDASSGYGARGVDTMEADVSDFLTSIITSKEYDEKWAGQIPGPFHPDFRYDRAALG